MIRKIAAAAAMMIVGLACFAESKVKQDEVWVDGYYHFIVEADTFEELEPYIDKFELELQSVIPNVARYRPLPNGAKERRDYWTFEVAKKPEATIFDAQAEVVHNTINIIMKDWYREKYYMRHIAGNVIEPIVMGY